MNVRDIKAPMDAYFRQGHTKSLAFRIKQLTLFEEMIKDHLDDICLALQQDLHKPRQETILSEVSVLLSDLKYSKQKLATWMKPRKVWTPLTLWPGKSRVHYEPLGTVLIIAPWNYPFNLALAPLIGALAAGNCALIKPSELTPHTSALIARLIAKTFDPSYVTVVEGAVEQTTALLELDFDHIFFTGSTHVGKIIMKAAAQHLTPVTLELGGKSPAFVTAQADLSLAARRLVWGKFFNGAQTCVAPDYLYVDQTVVEPLKALLIEEIKKQFGEDPRQSHSYARIVSDKHHQRLTRIIERDRPHVIYGGSHDQQHRYIEPTLLAGCDWHSESMQEELFGPILPILTYHTFEEALAEVIKRPKPLSAYLFSQDQRDHRTLVDQLSCGGVCINDTLVHLSNHHLPFGGVGASGMGNYHGFHSFKTFSHEKSVLTRTKYVDLSARYAPYTEQGLKLMRWLLGF